MIMGVRMIAMLVLVVHEVMYVLVWRLVKAAVAATIDRIRIKLPI